DGSAGRRTVALHVATRAPGVHEITAEHAGASVVGITLPCAPDEHVAGLGEQFTNPDKRRPPAPARNGPRPPAPPPRPPAPPTTPPPLTRAPPARRWGGPARAPGGPTPPPPTRAPSPSAPPVSASRCPSWRGSRSPRFPPSPR